MNLNGKSFLTLLDFTPDEITGLLDLAAALKAKKKAGVPHDTLRGKNIALIFEKTSTRTRCSFEVAAHDLGMHVTYLDPTGSQIGKKESIADTARVLGRLYDGIEYRGFGQSIVEELAKYAGVPVWNGLTNEFHPTQILADMLTIREHFGSLKGRKLVFLGDCRYNMANSLMIGCAKLGMHFVASGPEGYFPAARPLPPRPAQRWPLRRTRQKPSPVRTCSTLTSGSPWASRWKPGPSVWRRCSPIRSIRSSWTPPEKRPCSCTACPRSTTSTPALAARSASSSILRRWR